MPRHEPSDHAGERLGVRGEATRDDDAIRKVATSGKLLVYLLLVFLITVTVYVLFV